jgi:hypothetical protein
MSCLPGIGCDNWRPEDQRIWFCYQFPHRHFLDEQCVYASLDFFSTETFFHTANIGTGPEIVPFKHFRGNTYGIIN